METKEDKERREVLKSARDFIVLTAYPHELAGIIGCMLKDLDTKPLKLAIESAPDRSDLTERGEYSLSAMLEIIKIAEEYQKTYKQSSREKFPGMKISISE